jgi:uncharacterized repeat protein (TIGR01451 family)
MNRSAWTAAITLCVLVAWPGRSSAGDAPAGGQAPFPVSLEWTRSVFGYEIGRRGLYVADVDADGTPEIVSDAMARDDAFWYLASRDDTAYRQSWVSDAFSGAIDSFRVEQVDSDTALEVLVGHAGAIRIIDGATRQVERTIVTPAYQIWGLTVADVDADGARDLVYCDVDELFIHDLASGVLRFQVPGLGCQELAVGNGDADPALEIVLSWTFFPERGVVVDGLTHAVEWTNPGFGHTVRMLNLDSDPYDEVVGAAQNAPIRVWELDQPALSWEVAGMQGASAFEVLDTDQDGTPEFVWGDGGVKVYDTVTRQVEWSVDLPTIGMVDAFAMGELDGDAGRELVWSADQVWAGEYLRVTDTLTHGTEWTSDGVDGLFQSIAHGDVDADGAPELLLATRNRAHNSKVGQWFVHDAATKELEFTSAPPLPNDGGSLLALAVGNADGDAAQEVFAGYDDLSGAALVVAYDGITHAEQWRAAPSAKHSLGALAVGDVDEDGEAELVVAANSIHYPQEALLFVLDASTGAVEWQSPEALPGFWNWTPMLRIGNVDGDPAPEMVAATWEGSAFVVDRVNGTTHQLGNHWVTGLALFDRDGDGIEEIGVGTRDGEIRFLDAVTGGAQEVIVTGAQRVSGLAGGDFTGDGVPDVVMAADDELRLRDGRSGAILWTSGRLLWTSWFPVAFPGNLFVGDVDDDGLLEIVANVGEMGVRVYQGPVARDLELSVEDDPDPVLAGGEVAYTWTVRNPGAGSASGVRLDVALPPGSTFVSSTPGGPVCIPGAISVSCTLGTLAGGASVAVVVRVTLPAPGTYASTGTASALELDPDLADNTASASTLVTSSVQADLALSMEDGTHVLLPGQTAVYVLTARNFGPWPLAGIVLQDDVPPALLGPVFVPSTGTYDPATGHWTGLDLDAGASATLTLSATVAPSASGFIVNAAGVSPPPGAVDLLPGNNEAVDANSVSVRLGEVTHGTRRLQPIGPGGASHLWMVQEPFSSYEVVVDALSGDLGAPGAQVQLQRLSPDMSQVLAEARPVGAGPSRSLRWQNASSVPVADELLRVRSTGCDDECGPDDVFGLRAWDTTYRIARFNNVGGQATVVILQNPTTEPVLARLWFWSGSGTLLLEQSLPAIAPRGQLVINLAGVAALVGQSGSIGVTNDAPYGALSGKAVALDPAAGLSFDTPMVQRPR